MARLRWILAMALAAGCGGESGDGDMNAEPVQPGQETVDDAPPPPAETKACEGVEAKIGSGVRSYEGVQDGDTLWLYKGPQGGYMIYLGVRAKGLDRSLVYVDYEERFVSNGELFGVGQWKVSLTNDLGNGWYERVGIWGEIEPEYWTRPQAVRGKDIEMKVKLTDKNGCTIDNLGWTVHVNEDKPM